MSLAPGTRLGPYEIVSQLGAGGMGEVYRARDTRLGREVAIKVLAAHLSGSAEVRARFEREARTVSGLDHPHICRLFDVGSTSGTGGAGDTEYLVMEFLEGESLAARTARGPLPTDEVLRLGIQIADALACAHRAGVVHRDLKPGNIMLTRSGAKLLDFGLARAMRPAGDVIDDTAALSHSPTATEPLTAQGTLVGTYPYMAPEQLEGRDADARSDVWALGCVLYEMASGRRAFDGQSRASLIAAILEREPAPIPSTESATPAGLDRLVRACLAKDPESRVQTAQDVKLQLEWLRADVSAPAGSTAQRTGSASSLRGALPAITALSLLAAIVLGVFALRGTHTGSSTASTLEFQRRTFAPQAIFAARFVHDSRTIVLSAAKTGNRPHLYVLHADSPEPQPIGTDDVHLLAVSSRGELAVLDHAQFTGQHRLFRGTLARMPLEGAAPRGLMEDVREADWSPDGANLAVIHEVAGKDRLEYPIGKVLFESGGYLSDVRVSPSGDAIAFFDHPTRWDDRGSVTMVDRNGHAKVLSDGYSAMEGLAWSPNGRSVLFSATVEGSEFVVREVDRNGTLRTSSNNVGLLVLHDIAPDGTWATTRDEIPIRIAFRAAGTNSETDLSWLDSALQPVISHDGKTLALTDQSVLAGENYSTIVRPTTGGSIVRLGEGISEEFSPDDKSLIAFVPTSPPQLVAYPVGTGSGTRLDPDGFENYSCVRWLHDGKRMLVCGNPPNAPARSYVIDPASKKASPVGVVGAWEGVPSPDGQRFAARTGAGWVICSLAGDSTSRPLQGTTAADELIRWSPDGNAVFCFQRGVVPTSVDRIDVTTGKRAPVVTIADRDQAGLVSVLSVSMADDLKTLAYAKSYYSSALFTAHASRAAKTP